MQFSKIFVCTSLVAFTNAHMKITNPVPFDQTLDNSPLLADGSNFPCKSNGSPFTGTTNTMALGSKQTLSLVGTAVHGGGSCQVSLTTDTNPTKNSVWRVIHTIQGGCPARNQAGNLPGNDASIADPDTYDYTIPSNIAAGKYSLAWTWVNRIGNREFYMNCAAVTLTGTGGDSSNFDALPEMFVANIPSVSACDTSNLVTGASPMDVLIPNPGSSVETNSNFTAGYALNCGAGSGSGGSTATTKAGTTAAAATSSTAAGATGGVFITTPNGGAKSSATVVATALPTTTAKAVTTTAAVATSSAAAATSAAAAATSTAGSGSTGSSAGALSGSCTEDGLFRCIGGTSYQQCASGTWSVVMALAAGTSCTTGETMNLSIAAAGRKRTMRALRS